MVCGYGQEAENRKQRKVKSSRLDNLTLRQQLVGADKKVNWIPGFGLEKELDWLKNMHDWLISKKNRFWGLALPIWECDKCGYFEVIGGKNELREKNVKGWDKFVGHSPHKPWIDEIKIKCDKCGYEMSRIEPVGNPWLDAGIVPFSTMPPTPPDGGASWFPADFITESFPGQFKNWFYSLLVMSTVLKGEPPFRTVLGFESVTGEDGRPMHKSWGNMVEFNKGASEIGVDVMRWMYSRAGPTTVLPFGYKPADEIRRRFMLILWNSFRFFVTQAKADNWFHPSSRAEGRQTSRSVAISGIATSSAKGGLLAMTNILDRWFLASLEETIELVTKSLDDYQSAPAVEGLETFVEDFSTWYIRRSRDRIGPAVAGREDKNACYKTMFEVLTTLSKLLAPFMPYISDYMYTVLTGEESVHLANWPEIREEGRRKREEGIERQMSLVREIASLGHGQRKSAGIPVRQPLSSIKMSWLFGKNALQFLKIPLS